MNFGGALTGAVVAEVIDIDAIDDVLNATIGSNFVHDAKEFIFAVKAAIGIVGDVLGILEFAGGNHFMKDSVGFGEIDGITLVGFRDRGGICCDGDGVVTERFFGSPSQIGRIGTTGISDQDALHVTKDRDEVLLFEKELSVVEFLVNTLNGYERSHSSII